MLAGKDESSLEVPETQSLVIDGKDDHEKDHENNPEGNGKGTITEDHNEGLIIPKGITSGSSRGSSRDVTKQSRSLVLDDNAVNSIAKRVAEIVAGETQETMLGHQVEEVETTALITGCL